MRLRWIISFAPISYRCISYKNRRLREHRREGNTYTFDLAKLERAGESFNLKNRIETRPVTGNGHGEDVKAVKAPEIGYEDSSGNNGEVSREKNGLSEVEKQTKLPIPA